MIIYKITNNVNNKVYIGQTINDVDQRWKSHCSKHSCCRYLKNAIQKYGKERFEIEQIDVANSMDELNKKEKQYIENCNSLAPNGYNLKEGGLNGRPSEITRKKMSQSNKGIKKPKSSAQAIKLGKLRKGVKDPKWLVEKRRRAIGKKIVDITTGVTYSSVKEAGETLDIKRPCISTNLKDKSKSCRGRVFEYVEQWDGRLIPKRKIGSGSYQHKSIICINTGITYNSYQDAANNLNFNKDSLRVRMGKGLLYKGYRFEYV